MESPGTRDPWSGVRQEAKALSACNWWAGLKNSWPGKKKAIWGEEIVPRESKHKNNIKTPASSLGDLDQLPHLSERSIHAREGGLGGFDLMGKSLTHVSESHFDGQTYEGNDGRGLRCKPGRERGTFQELPRSLVWCAKTSVWDNNSHCGRISRKFKN